MLQSLRYRAIDESTPVGSFILQVTASDADEADTPHSQLSYQLEDNYGVFHIRPEQGAWGGSVGRVASPAKCAMCMYMYL